MQTTKFNAEASLRKHKREHEKKQLYKNQKEKLKISLELVKTTFEIRICDLEIRSLQHYPLGHGRSIGPKN